LGIGLLIAVLITMGLDREFWRISIVVGVPWVILVSGCYLLVRARRKRPEAGHAGAVLVKVNE
jgi:AAT family amino acid transporter